MKHEKLSEALSEISDGYIEEAARKRKKGFPWVRAVAAVLAIVIVAGILLWPSADPAPVFDQAPGNSYLLAAPEYPQVAAYPTGYEENSYNAWWEDQRALHDQPDGYADNLQAYFAYVIPEFLKGSDGENITCSPLNIYMALAMLAETTEGQTRQQILDLLKADSMDTLRTQAGQVWKAHYNRDGLSTSVLGSSLWLHEDAVFNEDTVNTLAEAYYASVFRGDLGSAEMNTVLQNWLNEQTEGLLQEQVQETEFSPNTVLALATTIMYQVQWQDEFREEKNTQATFHSADGDTEETFMNTVLSYCPYYWTDSFGAVYLPLEDGSRMWLVLPDEGVTPEDVLANGEVSHFFSNIKNKKSILVNLSIPKFDICSDMDLVEKLKGLGITDVFTPGAADFSPILPEEDGGYVDQVKHAARVSIDEKGVTAAAFTVITRCGAGMPPSEEIDFVLDRPFLFYIESSDGLPLFTGIVNEP